MKRLQSIKFGSDDTPLVNEMSPREVEQLRERLLEIDEKSRAERFIQWCAGEFSDKTFCTQSDYDSTFGNISWQRAYLFYADADGVIRKNWEEENRKGTPGYLRDDSFISIYKLGELAVAPEESASIADQLIRKVMNYKNNPE